MQSQAFLWDLGDLACYKWFFGRETQILSEQFARMFYQT
jgi:hypothetical protein